MSLMSIIKIDGQYCTFSFTTGLKKPKQEWCIRNDTDALAYAMHLSRNGEETEALRFLDIYCS